MWNRPLLHFYLHLHQIEWLWFPHHHIGHGKTSQEWLQRQPSLLDWWQNYNLSSNLTCNHPFWGKIKLCPLVPTCAHNARARIHCEILLTAIIQGLIIRKPRDSKSSFSFALHQISYLSSFPTVNVQKSQPNKSSPCWTFELFLTVGFEYFERNFQNGGRRSSEGCTRCWFVCEFQVVGEWSCSQSVCESSLVEQFYYANKSAYVIMYLVGMCRYEWVRNM